MEKSNQNQIPGRDFFGDLEHSPENVSELPQDVAEECRKAYFYMISLFQKLCDDLKTAGSADGNELKEAVEVIITSLKTDERMLLGLANAPYSYVLNHLDDKAFGSIVIHGVNVMIYSLKIAIDLGIPDIRLPYIGIAAVYHHLGLLELSEEKLIATFDKENILDEMGKYSHFSEKFIKKINIDDFHIDSIIYLINLMQKEDRNNDQDLDEAMYQYSMVIRLCYEFEMLTHQASYGSILSPVDAMKQMRDDMGDCFNKDIIKLFFNKLSLYPLGSFVKLSSNEIAKVVEINERFIIRPKVIVVVDNTGNLKLKPTRINLREKPNLYIKRAVVDDSLTEKYIDLF